MLINFRSFPELNSKRKIMISSGFKGTFKNGFPLCQCKPLALLSEPHSPAEGLLRGHEKLQRERQLRSWQRKQEACKGRGCDEEACGASMHAAPTSLLLTQPLQALLLGNPHRVSEDGKLVRGEGCFSD